MKMVDNDERFTYAPTVTVERALADHYLAVHPNPTREMLTISLNLDQAQLVEFTLFDIHGKMVKQLAIDNLDDYQTTLDLSDLNSGTYVLQVKSREKTFFKKVVVQ